MANRYEQLLIEQRNKSCDKGLICADPREQRRKTTSLFKWGVVEGFLQDVTQILKYEKNLKNVLAKNMLKAWEFVEQKCCIAQ